MITDAPPRKANHRVGFLESDRIKTLDLPQDGRLLTIAQSVESAMKAGTTVGVRRTCAEFLDAASEFYKVPACGIRVLSARPLRVRENWSTELFGDYTPETMLIRVWMKTAVRKEVTSFGTFLSTLCHEFCHHLDFQRFGFFGLVAYSRLLRASRRALPLRPRDAAKEIVLAANIRWAVEDRLAEDESKWLNPQRALAY
jgi:hypothetical protein